MSTGLGYSLILSPVLAGGIGCVVSPGPPGDPGPPGPPGIPFTTTFTWLVAVFPVVLVISSSKTYVPAIRFLTVGVRGPAPAGGAGAGPRAGRRGGRAS